MNQRSGPSNFLNDRETFEHYENRSRPSSAAAFHHGYVAQNNGNFGHLACEYRAQPVHQQHGDFRQSGDLRSQGYNPRQSDGHLACEYRAQPQQVVRAYIPESNKKKIPVGVIIAAAIGIPILIIICLFGAVWLQELGIL